MPALRDRPGDIAALAESSLSNRSFQRNIPKQFSPDAVSALATYDWPGNVRELCNAIERGIIMSAGEESIRPEHLGLPAVKPMVLKEDRAVTLHFNAPPSMDDLRDASLRLLLERHGGNRRRVAEISGISERNTYRLIQKFEGRRQRPFDRHLWVQMEKITTSDFP